MNFWHELARPIIGLAPMDGVTDHAFRYIQKKYGDPMLIYTEFSSVENICISGDTRALRHFTYDETQRPIIGQIYGHTPRYFWQVAILLCELGFDGIDINMGCPAKSVANNGAGAGLIRTPNVAQEIVRQAQAGVAAWQNGATLADCTNLNKRFAQHVAEKRRNLVEPFSERRPVPVSVKTRIGFDEPVTEAWISALLEVEPVAIGVHGRTLQQMYRGAADWEEIAVAAEVARGTDTVMLGNGDVKSMDQAYTYCEQFGVDGILVGRATYGSPFFFRGIKRQHQKGSQHAESFDESEPYANADAHFDIALEHAHLYEETFYAETRYHFLPMRKHLGWYIKSVPGARKLRQRMHQTSSAREVEELLTEFRASAVETTFE